MGEIEILVEDLSRRTDTGDCPNRWGTGICGGKQSPSSMDIHTDASMRSYELLSNEAAYPSTPGKTHDMGNGKVSLKHKHLQSIQDRYQLYK